MAAPCGSTSRTRRQIVILAACFCAGIVSLLAIGSWPTDSLPADARPGGLPRVHHPPPGLRIRPRFRRPFGRVCRAAFAQSQPRLRNLPFGRLTAPAAQQNREVLIRFIRLRVAGDVAGIPKQTGLGPAKEDRVFFLGVDDDEFALLRQMADRGNPMVEMPAQ